MIVVSDTSPINYLIQLDQVELLPQLFGKVAIPEAVYSELSNSHAPIKVSAWIASPVAWLEVRAATSILASRGVDQGEAEALSLALELGVPALIDDRKGREFATALGVPVIGTIGILHRAANQDLLDFEAVLRQLMDTNFHLAQTHLDSLLTEWNRTRVKQRE